MEIVYKLADVLVKSWPNGILILVVMLVCFAFVHFARQLQDIRATTISVKEKQFDQLAKLLIDQDLTAKPALLLELAFEKYFGFILSAEEIHHLLKSKKQLLAIRDLKFCRGMFKFESNEYIYNEYPDIDKKIKEKIFYYWLGSIMGIISIVYTLLSISLLGDIGWSILILPITLVVVWFATLDEIRSLRAAKRIALKEYGPHVTSFGSIGD